MQPNIMLSPSRPRLLRDGLTAFIVLTADAFIRPSAASQGLTVSKDRRNWRFCGKCQVMFYADPPENVCAADGKKHLLRGYNFFLPFGVAATSSTQPSWYCCKYCQTLFYAGSAARGALPSHQAGA